MYFIAPAIIYTFDKAVSLRTKYMALDVIQTELLPSDVIKIKFYRPPNLKYLSGQWVRLSCTAFRSQEMHSFTLTSAPHENYLSCHIKAQGPCNSNWQFFSDSLFSHKISRNVRSYAPLTHSYINFRRWSNEKSRLIFCFGHYRDIQTPELLWSVQLQSRGRAKDPYRGTIRWRQSRLVQIRGGRHGWRWHRCHAVRIHPKRFGIRHQHQPLLGRCLQKSVLFVDLSVA